MCKVHVPQGCPVGAQERPAGGETEGAEAAAGAEGAGGPYRQYFGSLSPPEPPELRVSLLPPEIPLTALDALRKHHRYTTVFRSLHFT